MKSTVFSAVLLASFVAAAPACAAADCTRMVTDLQEAASLADQVKASIEARNAANRALRPAEVKSDVCPLLTKLKTVATELERGIDAGCSDVASADRDTLKQKIDALVQMSDSEIGKFCQ